MVKRFTLKEIGEMVTFLVKKMATRDDVAEIVDEKLKPVKKTLAEHTKTFAEHTKILDEHTKILNDHTRDLNIIKHDVTTNLDKRLQLEVRMTQAERQIANLEK